VAPWSTLCEKGGRVAFWIGKVGEEEGGYKGRKGAVKESGERGR
jgi:hypothetical protein